MSEIQSTYHVSTAVAKPPFATTPPAVDPRLRLLLIAFRRALIIVADALAEYCELPEKGVR